MAENPFSLHAASLLLGIKPEDFTVPSFHSQKTNANPSFPKITIVTTSFNQAEYLEPCIQSILSQGYPNLEYIILDGGSTDGSVEIIEKYAERLAYWRSTPDQGPYFAIQEGFERSTGEIMGWLNSDDMHHAKSLFYLAEIFHAYPEVEFLTGRKVGFDKDGNLQSFSLEHSQWSRDLLLDEDNLMTPMLTVMQEGTFWKRSLWEKAGSSLDISLKYAADAELWLRFSRYAPLHMVNALLGGFRSHGESQRSRAFLEEYKREWLAAIRKEKTFSSVHPSLDHEAPPLIHWPPIEKSQSLRQPLAASDSARFNHIRKNFSMPKISIITPSLNQGEFLEECIDSVLSQSNCNIEYIIMDGGSSDNSLEIIKKYEKYLTYWRSKPDEGCYPAIEKDSSDQRDLS